MTTNQILRDALQSVTDVLDVFGNLPDGLMSPAAWNKANAEECIAAARAALSATGAAEAPGAVYQYRQIAGQNEWIECDSRCEARMKTGPAAGCFEYRTLYTAPPSPSPAAGAEMEARKDAAYYERNQVVAALAQCFPSGKARTAIEGWSEDWHGCVYIDLPTGQVSWHYHDSHAHLFNSLPHYLSAWDGHDTAEKYRRVAALRPTPAAEEVTGAAVRNAALEEAAAVMLSYGASGLLNRFADDIRALKSKEGAA